MSETSTIDINFQAESSKSGNEFQAVVLELCDIYNVSSDEIMEKVVLPQIGIELDYLVLTDDGLEAGEAKRQTWTRQTTRAMRTDNVKKAIANGVNNYSPSIFFITS